MSNSKNYNSIVFLTTLSVYLGLVLVSGATPSIFAQAALTQRFEIQNEIETDDDLDKNSDDEPCSYLKQDAESLLRTFSLDNSSLEIALGLIDTSISNFLKLETNSYSLRRKRINTEKSDALRKFLSDFEVTNFHFEFDNSEINSILKTSSNSVDRAQKLASAYNTNFNYWQCESQEKFKEIPTKLYQNTKISSENNQVFIVTRLPRASIDELLAETNAK